MTKKGKIAKKLEEQEVKPGQVSPPEKAQPESNPIQLMNLMLERQTQLETRIIGLQEEVRILKLNIQQLGMMRGR